MVATTRDEAGRQKVLDLIKDIRVALLVTSDAEGRLHGRPMSAMGMSAMGMSADSRGSDAAAFDGVLWFASREATAKLDEIASRPQVLLAYSEPKDQNYVSVSGTARVVRDPAKVRELWSEPARVWFPKGPDDPDIALIRVEIESAEYWDAPSSAWVYAMGYAKARLTGEAPKDVGDNKIVNF